MCLLLLAAAAADDNRDHHGDNDDGAEDDDEDAPPWELVVFRLVVDLLNVAQHLVVRFARHRLQTTVRGAVDGEGAGGAVGQHVVDKLRGVDDDGERFTHLCEGPQPAPPRGVVVGGHEGLCDALVVHKLVDIGDDGG